MNSILITVSGETPAVLADWISYSTAWWKPAGKPFICSLSADDPMIHRINCQETMDTLIRKSTPDFYTLTTTFRNHFQQFISFVQSWIALFMHGHGSERERS